MALPARSRVSGLKIAAGVLALGTLWLAGQTALVTLFGHGEQAFALSLENGVRPDWSVLEAVDRTGKVGAFAESCNRDLMRATVSIRLAAFDQAAISGTAIDRAKTAGDADAALRTLLRCNPVDGNAWLKLAIVDAKTLSPSDFDRQLLDASHWAAPNEGWILLPRIAFEVQLFNAGLVRIADALGADARRLAEAGSAGELARLYVAATPDAWTIFDGEIALMQEDRQGVIRASIAAAQKSAWARE